MIVEFPNEILSHIFSFLDIKSIKNTVLICVIYEKKNNINYITNYSTNFILDFYKKEYSLLKPFFNVYNNTYSYRTRYSAIMKYSEIYNLCMTVGRSKYELYIIDKLTEMLIKKNNEKKLLKIIFYYPIRMSKNDPILQKDVFKLNNICSELASILK